MHDFDVQRVHTDQPGAEQLQRRNDGIRGFGCDERQRRGLAVAGNAFVCGDLDHYVFGMRDGAEGHAERAGQLQKQL